MTWVTLAVIVGSLGFVGLLYAAVKYSFVGDLLEAVFEILGAILEGLSD